MRNFSYLGFLQIFESQKLFPLPNEDVTFARTNPKGEIQWYSRVLKVVILKPQFEQNLE